jgi:hypothetical protein
MSKKSATLVIALFFVVLMSADLLARTPASFRGKVIEPASAPAEDGKQGNHLIYVMSKNGALRRVEVSKAKIVYSEDVPRSTRPSDSLAALKHGTEVRVLAEENGSGIWKAKNIEILSLPDPEADQPPKRKAEPEADTPPGPVLTKRGS